MNANVNEKYFQLQYFCMFLLTTFFCTALDLLQTAIEKAGFTEKVVVGMDVAASEFHREGKYDLDFKSPPDSQRHISAEELADIYQSFVNNYPGKHCFVIFYATLNFISTKVYSGACIYSVPLLTSFFVCYIHNQNIVSIYSR